VNRAQRLRQYSSGHQNRRRRGAAALENGKVICILLTEFHRQFKNGGKHKRYIFNRLTALV
jgi:hypothetical protein